MKSQTGDIHAGVKKAKERYCSLPKWLPRFFRDYIEDRAWWVCKVHDNDVGKNGIISPIKAHWKLVKGIIAKSHVPLLIGIPLAVIVFPVLMFSGIKK